MSLSEEELFSQFSCKALDRYHTVKEAIDHLQRLGDPPSSYDKRHYQKVDDVLEVFRVLMAFSRGFYGEAAVKYGKELICLNWDTCVGPWILFIVGKIILAEDGPTTPEQVERLEHALFFIPGSLFFHGSDKEALVINASMDSKPSFRPLLIQAWIKTIDEHHPTFRLWLLVMGGLVLVPLDAGTIPKDLFDIAGYGPYKNDDELGLILIRHINFEARRIPTILYARVSPLHHRMVRTYTISSMTHLLSSAFKAKLFLDESSSDNEQRRTLLHFIAVESLNVLNRLMDSPGLVVEGLDAGIVKVIFKIHPLYFSLDDMSGASDTKLLPALTDTLQQTSKFLIYPTVVRRFSRISRKISARGDLEDGLKSNSTPIWNVWVQAKEKAATLCNQRRELIESGVLILCAWEECPLKLEGSISERPTSRYFCCSGCQTVTYCSHSCRKADWVNGHRESCADSSHDQSGCRAQSL
ncbi:hypothetical protein L218DRAFT_452550 [Marasmius fiardii PR-910]|nr:hypothetical protein L218DRAFT_452550 [Marasmius fiardii PR-910]